MKKWVHRIWRYMRLSALIFWRNVKDIYSRIYLGSNGAFIIIFLVFVTTVSLTALKTEFWNQANTTPYHFIIGISVSIAIAVCGAMVAAVRLVSKKIKEHQDEALRYIQMKYRGGFVRSVPANKAFNDMCHELMDATEVYNTRFLHQSEEVESYNENVEKWRGELFNMLKMDRPMVVKEVIERRDEYEEELEAMVDAQTINKKFKYRPAQVLSGTSFMNFTIIYRQRVTGEIDKKIWFGWGSNKYNELGCFYAEEGRLLEDFETRFNQLWSEAPKVSIKPKNG